mmetsp:Transcript_24077/g.67623  ORF Transcript_24077/g.67623 Transcript_24077/m.67623 type:complete len:243 (-) Transcript_24077:166-894(-)
MGACGRKEETTSMVSERFTVPPWPTSSLIMLFIMSEMYPPPRSCWNGNGCITASSLSRISTSTLLNRPRHVVTKSADCPSWSSATWASAANISLDRTAFTSALLASEAAAKRARSKATMLWYSGLFSSPPPPPATGTIMSIIVWFERRLRTALYTRPMAWGSCASSTLANLFSRRVLDGPISDSIVPPMGLRWSAASRATKWSSRADSRPMVASSSSAVQAPSQTQSQESWKWSEASAKSPS